LPTPVGPGCFDTADSNNRWSPRWTTSWCTIPGAAARSPHRYEQQRFARELAELLETQHNQGEFQRLVLVASPGMLGDLRASLSGRLRKLVYKEEAKDLTRLETDPLSQRVQALMQPF